MGDMHSQLDGLLSQASTHIDVLRHMMMATTWQDSTYQGDRFNGHMGSQQHSQYLSQFSQVGSKRLCFIAESFYARQSSCIVVGRLSVT